jgi:hypothetical protein
MWSLYLQCNKLGLEIGIHGSWGRSTVIHKMYVNFTRKNISFEDTLAGGFFVILLIL